MKPLRLIFATLALVLAIGIAGCGDGDEPGSDTTAQETEDATGGQDGSEGCRDVDEPKPKRVSLKKPKRGKLSSDDRLTAVVRTSCGTFEIRLDARRAPKTGASFVHLVERRVYDGTAFHRVVPDFVIQGGDPSGDGTGGPGYSVEEAPPDDISYTRGVVAMAKTPAEPPGTSGSQFYVVTAADAGLPAEYALLGKVSKGMDVVQRIGKLGDPASGGTGTPLETVVIEKVTIRRD